jgi:hypothetical protein
LLTNRKYRSGSVTRQTKSNTENLMNAPASSATAPEKSLSPDGDGEVEISRSTEQKTPRFFSQTEADAERMISSIARLTSNSINGLDGLSSELQQLQTFLKSGVGCIQGQIETALAGIKIIVETIAPWKPAPTTNTRAVRGRPAAHIESAQSRR